MTLEEIIIKQEKSLLEKETRSSIKHIRKLLSEDFMEIGASGKIISLSDVLESLPKEQNRFATTEDFNFRKINEEVVQLSFIASIKHNLKSAPIKSYRTSIRRLEGDTWKMFFHQGTVI